MNRLRYVFSWVPVLALGLLAGCATQGPNHVYVVSAGNPAVQDLSTKTRAELPALKPGEQVVGLAYDFNTDHLFLRLAPAQIIRVIERPSGKVLREMPLPPEWNDLAHADLAIRSSDRHIFALLDEKTIAVLTLYGQFVHRPELFGLDAPIGGLAFDQKGNRLLILTATAPARVGAVGPDGIVTDYVTLAADVSPVSLGYDSEARHFFVPLANDKQLGEFDAGGKLVATHDFGATPITAIDAGQRSFVRVF